MLSAPTNKYPPGLGLGAWRANTSAAEHATTSSQKSGKRSLRLPYPVARRAPPPPPRASTSTSSGVAYRAYRGPALSSIPPRQTPVPIPFNPTATINFSSHNFAAYLVDSEPPSPPPPRQQAARVHSINRQRAEDRAHLVAGILLNRVHAVGKPMSAVNVHMERKRREQPGRGYVRSSLSNVVAVAC